MQEWREKGKARASSIFLLITFEGDWVIHRIWEQSIKETQARPASPSFQLILPAPSNIPPDSSSCQTLPPASLIRMEKIIFATKSKKESTALLIYVQYPGTERG